MDDGEMTMGRKNGWIPIAMPYGERWVYVMRLYNFMRRFFAAFLTVVGLMTQFRVQ